MDKCFVRHFYGMGWREVETMPFSEFVKMFKAARMIEAQETLTQVHVSSFPNYKESDQNKFVRELKTRSTQYMVKKLKDYREVLGNLAKGMMKNG